MRLSRYPLVTMKDVPSGAEILSHQLMLRSGMIKPLASGLYSWLPLGLRVIRKIERIVREEMDAIEGLELLMPVVQPSELWLESGRWQKYGPELLRLTDRHQRDFCLGPTHEEVITDIARRDLKSYRQLPVTWYQIQTKFRDEIRPRFGVMRSREFIMKDAYSFHLDAESLGETYDRMYGAYGRICERMGLRYRAVEADSGAIGGHKSHEFHVLADSGEDAIAFSDGSDYAANVELAPALPPVGKRAEPDSPMKMISTPGVRSIRQLTDFLKIEASSCVKTLLVEGEEDGLVALLIRGDHGLNAIKAEKLPGVATPLTMATSESIEKATGCKPGFIGPSNLDCPVYADHSLQILSDFVCGANQDDAHLSGVNWGRDLPEPVFVDIRNVIEGDRSPDGKGTISIARGIEVGHVFQLGLKYSEAMNANVLDADGREHPMLMGCYGIGITRFVAAAIEQNNDDGGIAWPEAIAPFSVYMVPINLHKSPRVQEACDRLHDELTACGIEVLYDDRSARPGVKFADCDLLGIPHRIVVGERGLDGGTFEYKHRLSADTEEVAMETLVDFLEKRIADGRNGK